MQFAQAWIPNSKLISMSLLPEFWCQSTMEARVVEGPRNFHQTLSSTSSTLGYSDEKTSSQTHEGLFTHFTQRRGEDKRGRDWCCSLPSKHWLVKQLPQQSHKVQEQGEREWEICCPRFECQPIFFWTRNQACFRTALKLGTITDLKSPSLIKLWINHIHKEMKSKCRQRNI